MATQVMGQSSGGGGLFSGSGPVGMALPSDMYDLPDLSRAELAAPQLIMLANVALTGEVNGGCCDYVVGEERQMAELMPVGDSNFSDSDGEGLEESPGVKGEPSGLEKMELESLELSVAQPRPALEAAAASEASGSSQELAQEPPAAEDRCKSLKSKPFRCKPCQYEAESEEQFVHHIRVHSAKKFFVEESAEKQAKARESGSPPGEEGDFSKGPIRCERCGYNTNRYDHYTAHLKHHSRAGDSERVYKCIICTYTTVSEYHWRKHLRNHFPRKVYTCGKCSYFSDRKNNYVQHVRTHTGERPYKCELCPYSSSQKTHLTRHMRTHSGEKPFKCDQCSYVASNQHEVTRHARQVHNGPKPLNCPHCDYKTADRSNFKKHVELHVNPRQFNCPVCDYAASKKCNLQYHFKSKHPTCPNKTMDVSKVKLKKTKKREADLPDNKITSEKPETEQAKAKGDVAGKKNERSVKVEKKENVSREKKPCSNASSQVTTRTRKSAVEAKEVDVSPGNNSEKRCKGKKSKRKVEAEARSSQGPVNNDEEPVTKKKKRAESKSKNSQEVPKGDSKVEENRKQNICMKNQRKTGRSKPCKKSSQPAQRRPTQMESAQVGCVPREPPPPPPPSPPAPPPPPVGGVEVEVVQQGPVQMEPSPPLEPVQVTPVQMEPPSPLPPAPLPPPPPEPAQVGSVQTEPPPPLPPPPLPPPPPEPAQVGSVQTEPPPPPPAVGDAEMEVVQTEPPPPTEQIPRRSPRKDQRKEKSSMLSERARKEQVLIEVGLVPVKDTQRLKESACAQDLCPPSPPLPKENLNGEESKDQNLFPAGEGNKEAPLQKAGAEEADESLAGLAAVIKASANTSSSEQNLNMPEGETSEDRHQAEAMLCEMEVDTDEKKAENFPSRDSAVEEPVSPPFPALPLEKHEAESTAAVASPPGTVAASESQEMDEDEGIHSHDGSDLSDNTSEDSDDSGLNGARPVPQESGGKDGKEALAVRVAEGDFVCIFCDRSFRKEKDYSKHLNRHLVNVYFLEKAAQGQE